MKKTVLVVEDEPDLAQIVAYNLAREGYRTVTASSGEKALEVLSESPRPDLVLLDLMLPGMSGTEVCRAMRADADLERIPVIMLTARGDEIDRVVGFEVGADDYVTKPFSVRELMLRVRAHLRRQDGTTNAIEIDAQEHFGVLQIDRSAHRIFVEEQEIVLTALEFRLLDTFLQRRGRVQTRERLLSDVWGIDADVTTRTVDTHVKRLRQKIGAASAYIETIRGVGYRFVSELTKA